MNARPGTDRHLRFALPEKSRSFENAEDFFVKVKVIGRAAGQDRADELGDLALNQLAIPAVAGALKRNVLEADACRGGLQAARRAEARRYTDSRALHLDLRARRQKNPLVFFEVVEHLVAIAAYRAADDSHGDLFASQNVAGAELIE